MKATRDEVELAEAKQVLLQMEADPSFVTESAYRANVELWPKNRISFIEIHIACLQANPQITTKDYLANLRLKLRRTQFTKNSKK